jgi:hypothetical protein
MYNEILYNYNQCINPKMHLIKYSKIQFSGGGGGFYRRHYTPIIAGACEYGNELSGSIKCGEFLD